MRKKILFIVLVMLLALTGCKSKEERELEEANRQLQNSLKYAQDTWDDYYELQEDIETLKELQNIVNGYGN